MATEPDLESKESEKQRSDILYGLIPGVFTPFDDDYKLDEDRLRDHLDWLVQHVHSFTITAGVGEFYALTFEEWKTCVDIAVEKGEEHDTPVWTNFGAESYEKTIRQVRYAEEAGIDAVRIVIPYYVHPPEEGYEQYYKELASETDLPVLLYPATKTNRPLTAETIGRLAKVDNIVGIKVHRFSIDKLTKINAYTQNEDFKIVPANTVSFYHLYRADIVEDATIGPGPQIFPELTSKLWEAVTSEDWETAQETTADIVDIRRHIMPPGELKNTLSRYKYAAKLVGRPMGPTRRPSIELDDEAKQKMKKEFEKKNLI